MLLKSCRIVKLLSTFRNNVRKANFTPAANMLIKSCSIGKLLSTYTRSDFLIRNNVRKVNFTIAANIPPKICSIVKLQSRDFLIRHNGQKVNFTTDADMVNSTTEDDDEDVPSDLYGYSPISRCNIVNLLSTGRRDFLIRNNGQKVKIDTLKGKFVALLYVLYPAGRYKPSPLGLLEAYKTLFPKGDFEVVFVALTENDEDDEESYEWFNKYFQNMPWLAIPFSDFGTRKRVFDALSSHMHLYNSECRILDKVGNLVCMNSLQYFDIYGANWYPFTMQRISDIDDGMRTPIKEFSLKELLSSPTRDYLLTKSREKVLIDDLESKVVGLYFFDSRNWYSVLALRSVYDKLKAQGMDFEIVFINRHNGGGYPDEESFNKNFEKMPWLAIPFGEVTCEKLAHTLEIDNYTLDSGGPALAIIKPGVYCQLSCMKIIEEYGIEAYPFTVEKAAEVLIEKLSLFSLLDAEGQEFLIRNDIDKTKIKVSKLKGKKICMMLVSYHMSFKTLSLLINWYNKVKTTDNDFEVIFVLECADASKFDNISKQVPSTWLTLPFRVGSKIRSMLRMWEEGVLAAFNPDGKYLTKYYLTYMDERKLLSSNNYPYNVDIDTQQEMCDIIEHDLQ